MALWDRAATLQTNYQSMKESLIAGGVMAAAVFVALLLAAQFGVFSGVQSFSGAGSGQASFIASSTVAVGPQEDKTIFVLRQGCANRVVSSRETALMLSFTSSMNPSAVVGHQQSASTTISYDSDLFGCGPVTAFAYSSTTISVSEFSQ